LGTGEEFVAPQNDIEKKIASLWKEVLHMDKVGINDNFFDLGGTSIDVIKLGTRLNETFNINESVIILFRYTTIFSFAPIFKPEKRRRGYC
jgi:acyl carrier protein